MTIVTNSLTTGVLDSWATDPAGPVALYLKQRLLAVGVGDDDSIVFPPTYAVTGSDSPYNIDRLFNGTFVATIDSVGSQANRMEPIFKAPLERRDDWLVPQLEIELRDGERRSVLDLSHRVADAVARSSALAADIERAFLALQKGGDAGPLCALSPTSLVFGVWDSRGTHEKRPRLVRSIIRAWDVDQLRASTQFTSAWEALDQTQRAELEKEAKARRIELADAGFKPVPKSGAPGGVLVRGRIEREVTVNLVALRGLRGKDATETRAIQRYLLGLSLMAATADIDLSLREGCHLRYAGEDVWYAIPRRGEPEIIDLTSRTTIEDYTRDAAQHFRPAWPQESVFKFDIGKAKALVAKKDDKDTSGEA